MNRNQLIASVRQRLLNKARETGDAFDHLLVRYAVERFICRLGASRWADRFVLKGAMLFIVWKNMAHRPTRDLDLMTLAGDNPQGMEAVILEVIRTEVPDDGLTFDESTMEAEVIRGTSEHGGVRVKILIRLGNIRIPFQMDIGFGDTITPGPEIVEFPPLLKDYPSTKVAAYPAYTVIAEKLEALVVLDAQNSRMRDYFDLLVLLAGTEKPDPAKLLAAIRNTFANRKTPLPESVPYGLTPEFGLEKEVMWRAFLRKNNLEGHFGAISLAEVQAKILANLPEVWLA